MDLILLESIEFYLKVISFVLIFDFILDKSSYILGGRK